MISMKTGLKSWIFEQRLFIICTGCFLFYMFCTFTVFTDDKQNDRKVQLKPPPSNTSLYYNGLEDLTRDAAYAILSSKNHTRIYLESKILSFLSEESILKRTQDCKKYFTDFITASAFNSNQTFTPLAFSHLIHHDVGVFEVFMAVAFRHQNSHCIYVDAKASEKVFNAVTAIIKCYRETFLQNCTKCGTIMIVKNRVSVTWGHISILEAELVCLKYLISNNAELPLVSIEEMSSMLEKSGESIIENFQLPDSNLDRLTYYMFLKRYGFLPFKYRTHFDGRKRPPPPFNLTIRKGSKNVALNRTFAEYIINDELPMELYNWMHDMWIPDESFFSTLATVTKLENGTIIQDLDRNTTHGMCVRASIWDESRCDGIPIRSVCNFAVEDLPKLKDFGPCMIGNKFSSRVSSISILLQRVKLVKSTESWKHLLKNFI